jgi:hypothetical protein
LPTSLSQCPSLALAQALLALNWLPPPGFPWDVESAEWKLNQKVDSWCITLRGGMSWRDTRTSTKCGDVKIVPLQRSKFHYCRNIQIRIRWEYFRLKVTIAILTSSLTQVTASRQQNNWGFTIHIGKIRTREHEICIPWWRDLVLTILRYFDDVCVFVCASVQAATRVQSNYRGYCVRRELLEIENELAAMEIQVRCNLCHGKMWNILVQAVKQCMMHDVWCMMFVSHVDKWMCDKYM